MTSESMAAARPSRARDRFGAAFWWISPLVLLCFLYMPAVHPGGVFDAFLRDFSEYGLIAYLLLSTALIVPLLWRYERPVAVFAIVAAIAFAQWLFVGRLVPADLAVLVAMYAVARRSWLPWAVAAGVVAEFGVLLATSWSTFWAFHPPAALSGVNLMLMTVVAAIWFAGRYAKTRVRHRADAAERDRYAAMEREQRARLGAAGERARIARELHDVVAHNVSVMIVHAEGGRQALERRPQQAREALDTIWSTGKQVLAEMRNIIGVLREGDDAGGSYAPQPGVEDLHELISQVQASGIAADLTIQGRTRPLSSGLQLTIYRIVQESLTNALKHAGAGAHASVLLEYQDDEVVVEVRDDGGPRSEGGPPAVEDDAATAGHGLVGMRERAALYGGTLEAGPHSSGGYRVRALLPVIAGL